MLGCGNIGTFLLEQLNVVNEGAEKIVAIYSRNYAHTAKIAKKFGANSYDTFKNFLTADLDLVVEVATIEVIKEFTIPILERKIPLIVSSIGAFSDMKFLNKVKSISQENNVHVYIPSGAVGGLDVIQSANVLNGLRG